MRTQRRWKGFTLVEILVVVAIISVLAAILFTAFDRVRENGRATDCRSNLKQIALAVQQYAQDNNGYLPAGTDWLTLGAYIPKTTAPNQYFRCMTHPRDAQVSESDQEDYEMNHQLIDIRTPIFKSKHDALFSNVSTWWLNTDASDNDLKHRKDVTPAKGHSCGFTTWHSGGANFSFLDGHVKWLSPESACEIDNASP